MKQSSLTEDEGMRVEQWEESEGRNYGARRPLSGDVGLESGGCRVGELFTKAHFLDATYFPRSQVCVRVSECLCLKYTP